MTRRFLCIALFVALCSLFRAEDGAPLVLKNRHLALTFDRQTGGWISLVDSSTHEELIEQPAPRALILPAANPKLVPERIARPSTTGAAIDLTGEWLYTPTPPREPEAAALIQGKFEACPWQPTPVPSRRGAGDDRLHDRSGDFYYRRTFTLPDTWPEGDRMLVIGAVDDFDATYLNGTQIGATGVETPQHWQAPRYYRVPAGLLRKGQANVLLIKVTNGGFDGGIDGPLALGLASVLSPSQAAGPTLKEAALTRQGQAQMLTMVSAAPPYEYRVECVLPDDQAGFTRRITVRNISATETILQNQPSYATPPLLRRQAAGGDLPGEPARRRPGRRNPVRRCGAQPPDARPARRRLGRRERPRPGKLVPLRAGVRSRVGKASGSGCPGPARAADRDAFEARPGRDPGHTVLLALARRPRRGPPGGAKRLPCHRPEGPRAWAERIAAEGAVQRPSRWVARAGLPRLRRVQGPGCLRPDAQEDGRGPASGSCRSGNTATARNGTCTPPSTISGSARSTARRTS